MIITHDVKIDLMRPGIEPRIHAVQDDKYSRNLEITLSAGGVCWEVPSDAAALIRYRKPDGTGGEYDTLPDGTAAWSAKGHILTVALAPQVLTVSGPVSLAVTMIQGAKEITTFAVSIQVHPNVSTQISGSENYFNITARLPAPASAKVGQYFQVAAVDARGHVTEVRAVDAPAGGGADSEEVKALIEEYLAENPPVTKESDPTVPDWAKQPEKPKYTAEETGARPSTWMPTAMQVGADPAGTANTAVSSHNLDAQSHGDIRLTIQQIAKELSSFLDADDVTLDQLSELIAAIKSNDSAIDAITTSKVNVTDIVNDLVTNVINKPLSAAQGAVLKGLIDSLSMEKLDADKLDEAVNLALEQARESGEFDGAPGKDGYTPQKGVDYFDGTDGQNGKDGSPGKTPIKGTDYWTEADKAEIINSVVEAIGGSVIGTVDANNNIVLTGNLPAGMYTLKYENTDGTTTEIGTFNVAGAGPAYVNLTDPASTDWLTNKRINSSKQIVDVTEAQRGDKTVVITNFIDISGVTNLHIKGLDIMSNLSEYQNYGRMYLYAENTLEVATYQPSTQPHVTVSDYDSNVYILNVSQAIKDLGYTAITQVRFGGTLTGSAEDVIITADEQIV